MTNGGLADQHDSGDVALHASDLNTGLSRARSGAHAGGDAPVSPSELHVSA